MGELSNVIAGRVAATRDSRCRAGVGSLVSGREFGGVLGVVLVFGDALLAGAVAGFTAVESKAAGVVFFCAGGDVRAGHETVYPPAYEPTGVF